LLTYKQKPFNEIVNEIKDKIQQYKLPNFQEYYKQVLQAYKQTSIQQYKLFLSERLTNYYLESKTAQLKKL
jgi:L-rhamnose mutarotase